MKRLKAFATFTLLFLTSLILFANPVDINTAQKVANNYYGEQLVISGKDINGNNKLHVSLTKLDGTEVIYYIFNSDKGFIIVSADDDAYPVLGYSFEGTFNTENVSPEFTYWMNEYEKQIRYIKDNKIKADEDLNSTWKHYLADNFVPQGIKSGSKVVAPLLTSKWNQDRYYNYLCPEDTAGPDDHVYSGCVATAMAQIMYYYRYPTTGTGSHGYYSDYGYLSADFGTSTYNYNGMQNEISGKYNFDMAQLQLHCGIAIDMNYSPSGSGANMWDDVEAMKSHFGYSSTTELFQRNNYSSTAWANLLIANLDNKMPIQYAGYGNDGGHAFVCDGYKETDFFHFNWGWGGHFDGYFYLNNLNPSYSFNTNHQAILNSYPANNLSPNCTSLKTITNNYGTIEDGSSYKYNYENNKDCMWLIAPMDAVDYIRINFERFETESNNDIVTIYDGQSTADSVLGVFYGNNLPSQIISTGNKVLIRFTSNSSINANGWFLTYDSKLTSFCKYITELYSSSGTINDGSGNYNYNSDCNCKWRLNLSQISNVNINFNAFNMAADNDFVKIYDETANLDIATFTNASPPQSLTVTTDKVIIYFKTNSQNNSQGWELNYSATPLSVQENQGSYLLISPNPASDFLYLETNLPDKNLVNIEIYNSTGALMLTKMVNGYSDKLREQLDISNFAKGIYFIKLTSDKFRQTQRFIKQ